MNISCSVDLSYHSPVVWWNSQSSCVGLLPRSSQTGGKGSWTSRNTAQKSRYRGRCHSPNPGSNLKKKGKRKSDSRRHISFKIVWDFLMCQYAHGQIKESETLLTSEEAFLGVDEMVRGLVHLNLTLPRLGHVPYPGVAGYHVELKNKKMGKTKQILTFEAPCVYATLVSALAPLSLNAEGNVITFENLSKTSNEKLRCWLPATYSQHLSLQKGPVLHAAGGVHMKQLTFDGGRVSWRQKQSSFKS